MFAAMSGMLDFAKLLIENCADVNRKGRGGTIIVALTLSIGSDYFMALCSYILPFLLCPSILFCCSDDLWSFLCGRVLSSPALPFCSFLLFLF